MECATQRAKMTACMVETCAHLSGTQSLIFQESGPVKPKQCVVVAIGEEHVLRPKTCKCCGDQCYHCLAPGTNNALGALTRGHLHVRHSHDYRATI